jgi:peptide methionine sulfoxide reductase MsrA
MRTTEISILAGGCFWGLQDLIRKLPGVISTRVGYSGGDVRLAQIELTVTTLRCAGERQYPVGTSAI